MKKKKKLQLGKKKLFGQRKRKSKWFTNGGAPKRGWYKGYWCDSSWELAFVMFHLDYKISIVRNTKLFPYTWYGRQRMWMPDFIINGEYVEIKGVFDGKNKRKLACFQLPIRVIGKNEIGKYLHYAKSKYGPDFTSLYDKTE